MANPNLITNPTTRLALLVEDQLDPGANDYTVPASTSWTVKSVTLHNTSGAAVRVQGWVLATSEGVARQWLDLSIASTATLAVPAEMLAVLPEGATLRFTPAVGAVVDVLVSGVTTSGGSGAGGAVGPEELAAALDALTFTDIDGTVSDAQIPAGIARDTELAAAISALPVRAGNTDVTSPVVGQVVAVAGTAPLAFNLADPLPGDTGGVGPQGPPGLVWRGAWNTSLSYAVDDAVTHAGRAFIAVAASTGVTPPTSGTSSPSWGLLADRGDVGPGATGVVTPANRGVLGWTFDPVMVSLSGGAAVFGQMLAVRLSLPAGTVSRLHYRVQTAGTTLTAGQNFAVLYRASDNTLVASVDQTSAFTSTGLKVATLTTPVAITAGEYYTGFLVSGTGTLPQFLRAPQTDTAMTQFGVSPGNIQRAAQLGGAGLTAPPATAAPTAGIAHYFWVAVS